MAEIIWQAADSFSMAYGVAGTGSIVWSGFTDEDPEFDHAVSGQENGTISFDVTTGTGNTGQSSGSWDASAATAVFNDSSEWLPPTLVGTRSLTSATVDVDMFAEIVTVGSGTGSVGELIDGNITNPRNVLAGVDPFDLPAASDPRLASDTTIRMVIVVNSFSFTKTCYTTDNITPATIAKSFFFTGAVDGNDISVPELKAIGATTVAFGDLPGGLTTAFNATTALASKAATSAVMSAGAFPHVVNGSGSVTHNNITLSFANTSASFDTIVL